MPGWHGPGFVDDHAHLLQVASEAMRLGPDPYMPRQVAHDPGATAVTAGYHRRVFRLGSTPMDQPALPIRVVDLPGAIEGALREAANLGLVRITEAGVTDWRYLEALEELRERGPLPVKVRLLIASGLAEADPHRLVPTGDTWLDIIGVKFYADGWLVPRTCALTHPFADKASGDRGILYLTADALARRAEPFAARGFTIATHAIGDRAVEAVLDAYEMLYGSNCRAVGPRVEHAQVVTDELIDRMADMGVVVCIQPSFAVADADEARKALGDRVTRAYRWRDFIDRGVRVITGSDFPVETLSPLWGLRRLVTGADVGGEQVAEPLPLDMALSIMTDADAGSVALDEDPHRVDPEALHRLEVYGTMPAETLP